MSERTPKSDGWQDMASAPKTGPVVWVIGRLANGSEVRMHYACNMSGEEQPPFRGWFADAGSHFYDVEPVAWRFAPLHTTEGET